MTSPLLTQEMLRVLVLLDQPLIADMVRLTLNHGQFVTREVTDTQAASKALTEWQAQLAVVDIEFGGHALISELTNSGSAISRIPVLALTRRGDLKTKLAAFEAGVEDIMVVPFSPEELLARVLVMTRRKYTRPAPLTPTLKVGDLELDILNRQVRVGTSTLHLTGLEQSLLYLLVGSAGTVITRQEVLDALWGVDFVAESNVVDRHIRSLRAKLQNDWRKPRFIETVPGHGYRFIPTIAEEPAVEGESAIQA